MKVRAAEALGKTVPGLFKGEERTVVQRTPAEIRAEITKLYEQHKDKLEESVH